MKFKLQTPDAVFAAAIGEMKNFKKYAGDVVWSLTADEVTTIDGQEGTLAMLKRLTPQMHNAPDHVGNYWTRDAELDNEGFIDKIIIHNTSPNAYPLLRFLEYGTRPHFIRGGTTPVVVPGKPLHFTISDGTEIFASLVWHPGTTPYGMVRQTKRALFNQLTEVNKAISDIVQYSIRVKMQEASKEAEPQ
jgi:hypothetical protein